MQASGEHKKQPKLQKESFKSEFLITSSTIEQCLPILFVSCTRTHMHAYEYLQLLSHYSADRQLVAVTLQETRQCGNKSREEAF